jgi:hypothetical protein
VAGLYALSSWEVASRLSYLLWGAPPDDTLAAAADAGQLTTPDQILTQAQRMVTNTKAHDKVAAFHRFYMLIGTNTKWDNTNHDTSLFPAFTKAVVPTLQAETERFFDEMVFNKNGSFQDLITSPLAWVNSQTAPLYGVSATGLTTDLKETSLSASQRPGFLTRVGFLNAYSAYNRSSPILRGAFITKNILGTKIGSPPPGAEMTMLPTDANLDTNRKQVDAQTSGSDCAPCHHSYINPPGFVMENFNSVGTWQTTEKTTGVAIDPVVDMAIDGKAVHINNVAEMMAAIAASPMAQSRYAERWTSYSYEREGDVLDSCTVADLAGKIAKGGYTVRSLITDLTQTTQFRTRAVGPPNEPPNLPQGYRWRQPRGALPELAAREEGVRAVDDPFPEAPGHLLHAQRVPDRPLVPQGDQRRAHRRFHLHRDARAAGPVHPQAADPARIPIDERLRVRADDRSARPGLRLEADLRDDRLREQAVRHRRVAGSRGRQADQSVDRQQDAARALRRRRQYEHQGGALVLRPGRRVPGDRQPDHGLQPADRRLQQQRRDATGELPGGARAERARPVQGRARMVPGPQDEPRRPEADERLEGPDAHRGDRRHPDQPDVL